MVLYKGLGSYIKENPDPFLYFLTRDFEVYEFLPLIKIRSPEKTGVSGRSKEESGGLHVYRLRLDYSLFLS